MLFLSDNGSLRPDSFRNLRRVAGLLSEEIGESVVPASVLHSDKIDAALLDGQPALTLEPALRKALEAGCRQFGVIPFFFGPTGALTWYLEERVAILRKEYGHFEISVFPFLFPGDGWDDGTLTKLLAENTLERIKESGLKCPPVILVDHGSPAPQVTYVRNYLAGQLSVLLQGKALCVGAASMESREGEQYAFNQPLLAEKLKQPPFDSGDVVVTLLFLSPGRHAGPAGDIATICSEAEKVAHSEGRTLSTHISPLVGTDERVVRLLVKRYEMGTKGMRTSL